MWARNGLSHPELETLEGRVLFESLQPVMAVSALIGRGTLEDYLLARHRAIDALLAQAIEVAGISQVVEVAAGLSARGWRFASRFGGRLTYIEADLPGMVARKRRALERMGTLGEHHRLVELDVLRARGSQSLAALVGGLDPDRGLAIVTEGLLGYLPTDTVRRIWERFAGSLDRFARGRYISDIHIGAAQDLTVRAFRVALSLFVRGRVHLHFNSPREVVSALRAAGFEAARVRRATELAGETGGRGSRAGEGSPAAELSHILEASIR